MELYMFSLTTCAQGASPKGLAALQRLLGVAHTGTGQARVVARFLVSLYNGDRFPFDLTDFRALDTDLLEDCLDVLVMDNKPHREVHKYFDKGGQIWEAMASDWGFKDHDNHSWR
jgi:ParB family transcriptional regulator, chromosome partitioning protein